MKLSSIRTYFRLTVPSRSPRLDDKVGAIILTTMLALMGFRLIDPMHGSLLIGNVECWVRWMLFAGFLAGLIRSYRLILKFVM